VYFLTKGRRGYCQQFAGAMAVLLRSLGYSARVAVGFLPGTYSSNTRSWDVSTNDYHAWVQVLFPGYGWLSFDPTPTKFKSNPTIALYDDPVIVSGSTPCDGPRCFDETNGGPVVVPPINGRYDPDVRNGPPPNYRRGDFAGFAAPAPREAPRVDLRRIGLLTVGVLTLVLLLGIPLVRGVRRRIRLRRGSVPRGQVLAAYAVLLEVAADVGRPRHPAETIREYRRRLARTVRFTNGDFETLSALADRAAYAEDGLSGDDGRRAADLCRTASRDLRKAATWWRNLMGHYPLRFGGERSVVL
jgi:hypothetical protein